MAAKTRSLLNLPDSEASTRSRSPSDFGRRLSLPVGGSLRSPADSRSSSRSRPQSASKASQGSLELSRRSRKPRSRAGSSSSNSPQPTGRSEGALDFTRELSHHRRRRAKQNQGADEKSESDPLSERDLALIRATYQKARCKYANAKLELEADTERTSPCSPGRNVVALFRVALSSVCEAVGETDAFKKRKDSFADTVSLAMEEDAKRAQRLKEEMLSKMMRSGNALSSQALDEAQGSLTEILAGLEKLKMGESKSLKTEITRAMFEAKGYESAFERLKMLLEAHVRDLDDVGGKYEVMHTISTILESLMRLHEILEAHVRPPRKQRATSSGDYSLGSNLPLISLNQDAERSVSRPTTAESRSSNSRRLVKMKSSGMLRRSSLPELSLQEQYKRAIDVQKSLEGHVVSKRLSKASASCSTLPRVHVASTSKTSWKG